MQGYRYVACKHVAFRTDARRRVPAQNIGALAIAA